MFAREVTHKKTHDETHREDTRVAIDDDGANSAELEPLLSSQKKAQEVQEAGETDATTLTSLTSDIWSEVIPYLSVNDIISLRRSNPIVRSRINSALHHASHSQTVATLFSILRQKKDAYVNSSRPRMKKLKFYLLEAVLAEAGCILNASLPINKFQASYVSAFQDMSQTIMNASSVTITWASGFLSRCYQKNTVWNMPPNCIYNCASNNAVDGPAGYWFAAWITANTAYITARVALSIPVAKYPVRKITFGLIAFSLGGLAVSLPVIANQGWAESSAIRSACCLATSCDLYGKIFNCAGNTQTYTFKSFCFNGINAALPLIPALIEVPPLILTGITVGALFVVGLWAYKKSRLFSTDDHDIDPNNELPRRN